MRILRFIYKIAKITFKKVLISCVLISTVLFTFGGVYLTGFISNNVAEASVNPADKQYMISIGPVSGNVSANYVLASAFNPATSSRHVKLSKFKVVVEAVLSARQQNLTIRRITTSVTGGTSIATADIVKKNEGTVDSIIDVRYNNPTVTFSGTTDSRMFMVLGPNNDRSYVGPTEMVFDQTESIILAPGEGIALYQEEVGDVDERLRLNISWEELDSAPTATDAFTFSFPRVENAAAIDYKYFTFFNPVGSGKTALVKRIRVNAGADAASTDANSIYVRRISAASAGTQILASNVPKKNTGSADSVMEFRHTGVTATLVGTTDSKYFDIMPSAAAAQSHSNGEILFTSNDEYIVLAPGEGIALVSSAVGDVDQLVRLSLEWSEQATTPSSQGEYVMSIGPITGVTTSGYNYISFFNPSASGKYAVIKRIAARVDTVNATAAVAMTVQRISNASAGTQVTAANIPKKASTTPDTVMEVRHTNVTATKVGGTSARLMTLNAPVGVGTMMGHQELQFETSNEYLVLAPGEGIVFYQESTGDIDLRVKLLLEWKEESSAPTAQNEYLFSSGSVTGVTTNGYKYVSIFNPSGSGKTLLLNRIDLRLDAAAAAGYIPFRVTRVSGSTGGTLIGQTDIHRKATTSSLSVAEIRTSGMTTTFVGSASSSLIAVTSPGAAPSVNSLQFSGYESHDYRGEKLVLREDEGIVLWQDGAGDADLRVKILFDWKEQESAPSAQKEYIHTVGPLVGSTASGYSYATVFNPLGSNKRLIIRRLSIGSDAVTTAVFIPITIARISAASGGTLIPSTDITEKNTSSANSSVELRHSNVTRTLSYSAESRILGETTPGSAGQTTEDQRIIFEEGYELVLEPGEGLVLYQEGVGSTAQRNTLKIVWQETLITAPTISGKLYSDEGVTEITSGGKVINARIDGSGTYSTTTVSGSGSWYIELDSAVSTGTVVSLFVDGDATTRAFALTKASSTANITNLDLYKNRVIVKHEATSGTTTRIEDLALFDKDNDSDIQFTANSGTLVIHGGQELHIWTGTTFEPRGTVTLQGNAQTSPDGDLHIDNNATFVASTSVTLAGNWAADTNSIFVSNGGTVTFNATTTGKTIAGTLTGASSFAATVFNGVGGAWTFSNNASTTNFTITNGTVTAPTALSIQGNFSNSGIFTHNSGTVYFTGAGKTAGGTLIGSSAFNNVTLLNDVTGPVQTASQIGGDGLNSSWADTTYERASSMITFNGKMYAGLGSGAGDAEVWEYNGTTWTQIGGDGLNSSWADATFEFAYALLVFNNKLYASLGSGVGDGEVWEYNGTTWSKIGGDGVNSSWADATYEYAFDLEVFNGKLYAGLGSGVGDGEVWEYNGTTWSKIGGDGVNSSWADATYEYAYKLITFNNKLYAGLGASVGDGEVWEYNASTTIWTKVGGDSLNGSWANAGRINAIAAQHNKLYVGLGSATGDGEVWEYNGTTWSKIGGDGVNSSWADATYEFVYSMAFANNRLYAGLGSGVGEAEVWEYNGSTWTKVAGDGVNNSWADGVYGLVTSFNVFNNDFYVGIGGSNAGDAEIWKLSSLPASTTLTSNASTTNLTIGTSTELTAPSGVLSISGNYTNLSTFTHNSGTTTLNGTSQQTLTGNMTASSAFYGLVVTNNSGTDPVTTPSVIFASAASSTSFSALTASTTIRFGAGLGYTFTKFSTNGQNTTSRVQLRSSTPTTAWKLYASTSPIALNTYAMDSDASGGIQIDATNASNFDGTGNTNWSFGSTISCTTNISSTTFSALSLAQVQTASPHATTTFSCSSGSGCSLSLSSAGNGVTAGLATTSPAYLIPSATTTLSAGTEGYGVQAATTTAGSGNTLNLNSVYDKTGNSVGGLLFAGAVVASSSNTFTDREVVVIHKAAIAATTPVGSYTDTLTYSCIAN